MKHLLVYIKIVKQTMRLPRHKRKAIRDMFRFQLWQVYKAKAKWYLFIRKFDKEHKDNYPF